MPQKPVRRGARRSAAGRAPGRADIFGQIKTRVADELKAGTIKCANPQAQKQYHWALTVYWLAVIFGRLIEAPVTMVEHDFSQAPVDKRPAHSLAQLGYFIGGAGCDILIETARLASYYYGVAENGGAIPILPAENFDGTWYESAALHQGRRRGHDRRHHRAPPRGGLRPQHHRGEAAHRLQPRG